MSTNFPVNTGPFGPLGPQLGPDSVSGQGAGEVTAAVIGSNPDAGGIGVIGFGGNGAGGFLGGNDPQFSQHAGVRPK